MAIDRRGIFARTTEAAVMAITTLVACNAHAVLGTQTISVDGKIYSATDCSFTAFSDSGTTPLTVHLPPAHGSTVAGLQTLYSMMVMGSHLYISWTNGV